MNNIKSKRINNDWYIETKNIILKMNKSNKYSWRHKIILNIKDE